MKLLISFIALLLLVGCAEAQVRKNTKARKINYGKSIDYAEGYADGDSIRRKSEKGGIGNSYTFTKDTARYRANDEYKHGWDDGFMGKGNYEEYTGKMGH